MLVEIASYELFQLQRRPSLLGIGFARFLLSVNTDKFFHETRDRYRERTRVAATTLIRGITNTAGRLTSGCWRRGGKAALRDRSAETLRGDKIPGSTVRTPLGIVSTFLLRRNERVRMENVTRWNTKLPPSGSFLFFLFFFFSFFFPGTVARISDCYRCLYTFFQRNVEQKRKREKNTSSIRELALSIISLRSVRDLSSSVQQIPTARRRFVSSISRRKLRFRRLRTAMIYRRLEPRAGTLAAWFAPR